MHERFAVGREQRVVVDRVFPHLGNRSNIIEADLHGVLPGRFDARSGVRHDERFGFLRCTSHGQHRTNTFAPDVDVFVGPQLEHHTGAGTP